MFSCSLQLPYWPKQRQMLPARAPSILLFFVDLYIIHSHLRICATLKLFRLFLYVFWGKKNKKGIALLFSAAPLVLSKKKITPKFKKRPKKLPIICHQLYFSVLARLSKRPKNRNPVPPKAPYCRTGYLDWEITRIWVAAFCDNMKVLEFSIPRTEKEKSYQLWKF